MQGVSHFADKAAPKERGTSMARGIAVVLVLALATVLLPSTAGADRPTFVARAYFSSTDGSGIVTAVLVVATAAPSGSDVVVEVSRANPACSAPGAGCPYVLLYAWLRAPLADRGFRIGGSLSWATLETTVEPFDTVSGTPLPVAINLTWAAIGGFVTDGARPDGFRRAAAAGLVASGATDLAPTQPSLDGELERYAVST